MSTFCPGKIIEVELNDLVKWKLNCKVPLGVVVRPNTLGDYHHLTWARGNALPTFKVVGWRVTKFSVLGKKVGYSTESFLDSTLHKLELIFDVALKKLDKLERPNGRVVYVRGNGFWRNFKKVRHP